MIISMMISHALVVYVCARGHRGIAGVRKCATCHGDDVVVWSGALPAPCTLCLCPVYICLSLSFYSCGCPPFSSVRVMHCMSPQRQVSFSLGVAPSDGDIITQLHASGGQVGGGVTVTTVDTPAITRIPGKPFFSTCMGMLRPCGSPHLC